jgi:hypothetical protein
MASKTPEQSADIFAPYASATDLNLSLVDMHTTALAYRTSRTAKEDPNVFAVSALVGDIIALQENTSRIQDLRENINMEPRRSMVGLARNEGISKTAIQKQLKKLGITPDDLREPSITDLDVIKTSPVIRSTLEDVTRRFSSLLGHL